MSTSIATLAGIALRPGVSLNRRYYSPEVVAGAVRRAKERIAAGGPPMTCMTHHDGNDDSTRIIGRITSMDLDRDGAAVYTAELADTPHARTCLELLDPANGPYMEGVSIRGFWRGDVRKVEIDGVMCETTDDLEIDGVDLTKSPGVPGARVNSVTRTGARAPAESVGGRTPIYESATAAPARPMTTEERHHALAAYVFAAPVTPIPPAAPAPATALELGIRDAPIHELNGDEFRRLLLARVDEQLAAQRAARSGRAISEGGSR